MEKGKDSQSLQVFCVKFCVERPHDFFWPYLFWMSGSRDAARELWKHLCCWRLVFLENQQKNSMRCIETLVVVAVVVSVLTILQQTKMPFRRLKCMGRRKIKVSTLKPTRLPSFCPASSKRQSGCEPKMMLAKTKKKRSKRRKT